MAAGLQSDLLTEKEKGSGRGRTEESEGTFCKKERGCEPWGGPPRVLDVACLTKRGLTEERGEKKLGFRTCHAGKHEEKEGTLH